MADDEVERLIKGYAKAIPDLILATDWFKTRDEDDPEADVKSLPNKDYLRFLLNEYCTCYTQRIPCLIPKSRQLLMTWSWAAYGLARMLTWKHKLIIYQTKREEDSVGFMGRVHFMYRHLPEEIRAERPAYLDNTLKLELPGSDVKFWAIPQGADIIRSNTVSLLFLDELNFQPNARASLRAAVPSLGKHGQLIAGSSANAAGLMEKLIHATW